MSAATNVVTILLKAKRGTVHTGNYPANVMRIARALADLMPKYIERVEVDNDTSTGFGNATKRTAIAVRQGKKKALRDYLSEGQG